MKYLATILRFGWPYLRRYRERLFLGVMLGLIFGLSNVGILGASKMVLVRLEPPAVPSSGVAQTTIASKVAEPSRSRLNWIAKTLLAKGKAWV